MRSVIAFSLLLLVGCGTEPIRTETAREVRQTTAFRNAYPSGTGEIVVKRDTGFAGSACGARVFANAVPVADLYAGEKITFRLPDGEHVLSARLVGDFCLVGTTVETRATAARGRSSVFRLSFPSTGGFLFQPTAF
jgi:hypothetical protein